MKARQGYTLLEILIVLVIISITASMAVLTIGHNQQSELKAFVQELSESLTLAEEQALLQPTTLALFITAQSFGFYEYHQDLNFSSWKLLADSDLGLHSLPLGIQIKTQANHPLQATEQGTPAVIIASNGHLSPFTLFIGSKDKPPSYEIIGHEDGTILSQVYQGEVDAKA